MSPFVFLGFPLFSSDIFLMSPFAFLGLLSNVKLTLLAISTLHCHDFRERTFY
jgi:hypothetical protein